MRPLLPYPCLCLVTDRTVCAADEMSARVAAAVSGGVDVVQVRDKDLPGQAVFSLTSTLRSVTEGRALLLVNERADVAVAGGADGVQLGEAAMSADIVRRVVGEQAIVGRSVHSVEGALEAAATSADFLLVGTMFATRSHPGEEPAGPGLLTRIRDAGVSLPLVAIGGIDTTNVADVMGAGAWGAAVITSILASDDPEAAAKGLKSAMLAAIGLQPDPEITGSVTEHATSNGR